MQRRMQNPTIEPRALTIAEAAAALQVGQNSLRNLIASKRLHAVRIGSRVIVPTAAIDAFLNAIAAHDRT